MRDDELTRQLAILEPVYDARFDDASFPFPFGAYDEVLEEAVARVGPSPGSRYLDLTPATGNLAAHFHVAGCEVWALTRDPAQTAQLRARLPGINLVEADVFEDEGWIDLLGGAPFDCVGSAYALHRMPRARRLVLIDEVAARLLPRKGSILIADVSFETRAQHDEAAARWPDAWREEHDYWIAEEDVREMSSRRFKVSQGAIPPCGGFYRLKKR